MVKTMIRRNILIFSRDRVGVFLSLLSSLILFALYVVFLGGSQVSSLQRSYPLINASRASDFVYNWVFAGIIVVTIVSTTLGAIHSFVTDRISGVFTDFAVSPIKKWKLVFSYFASCYLISIAVTTVVFVFCITYLDLTLNQAISIGEIASSYGIILLGTITFSGLSSLLVTFVKSESSFTSIGVISGTLAGFLATVYVPSGALPSAVRDVINVLPYADGAALIRKAFTTLTLNALSPTSEVKSAIARYYGVAPTLGARSIGVVTLVVALLLVAVFTLAIAVLRISRQLR